MKPDCKVNMGELTSIVEDMLASKNKTGREAFKIMTEETFEKEMEDPLFPILDVLKEINRLMMTETRGDTPLSPSDKKWIENYSAHAMNSLEKIIEGN